MRTATKKAGASPPRRPSILFLPVVLSLLSPADVSGEKNKKAQESYALIAGTVFRSSGFSLPGAEVTVTPDPDAKPRRKLKKTKVLSDSRGEFAVRVPAEPMRYTVSVKAGGFRPQEKPVSIQADERVDLFFHLEAETKKR